MQDDLEASERRLVAALARIEGLVEAIPPARPAPAPGAAAAADGQPALARLLEESRAENLRLGDEIAALRERQAGQIARMRDRLEGLNRRLAASGAEAARLVAANRRLAEANRALIAAAAAPVDDAAGGEARGGAVLAALEAEIESLRAARAAEVGQMGDILDALERMLAQGGGAALGAAIDGADMLADGAAAAKGPAPDPDGASPPDTPGAAQADRS